jgi:hypothetical protein
MPDFNKAFNYKEILERAIEKLFERDGDAEDFEQLLNKVSCPPDWRYRIGLAILKICGPEIDRIEKFVSGSHDHATSLRWRSIRYSQVTGN